MRTNKVLFTACTIGAVLLVGCGSDGFRAQELPPKNEIQKKIDLVTASTTISPGAKPMILAGLKKQLAAAKP